MKKVTYEEFKELFSAIDYFRTEQDKANEALKVIFKETWVFMEQGEQLLVAYIDLMQKHLDCDDWIEWYVFERSDKCNHVWDVEGKEYKIQSLRDMYDFLLL